MANWRDYLPALPWRRDRLSNAAILAAGNDPLHLAEVGGSSAREQRPMRPPTDGKEYGAAGTENYGGYLQRRDYNHDLDDFVKAMRIYEKMRNDGQIASILAVLKQPLRGATWVAMPPEDGDAVDQMIADYVNGCLFDTGAMEHSWDYTLRHILMQLEFGFSILEKVWTVDETGAYRLRRLAPRLPKTVRMWHVDPNGRLLAVTQYAPVPVGGDPAAFAEPKASTTVPQPTSTVFKYLTIPSEYLAVFTREREGDNYEGISIFRPIYRNWFYKDQAYHLEGVRLDRWGVGIPVAQLSDNNDLTDDEMAQIVEILKKVRANERAFLVAPPGVEYKLLPETGSATAGSGATSWIDHHDAQIARSVLAGFLTMGTDPHGTLGFGSRLTDLFISSLRGIAAGIGSDLQNQVVKQLCELNFDMTNRKHPTVTCRDLEQVDLNKLVETLVALGAAQDDTWIHPDDDSEKLLRKMLQLPPMKPDATRAKRKKEAEQQQQVAGASPQPTLGQHGAVPNNPAQGELPLQPAGPPHPAQNPTQPAPFNP